MGSGIRLGALAVAFIGIGTAMGLTSAQAIEPDRECEASCYAEHTDCVESCQSHENPIECDGDCQDDLEDCLESCG